MSQPPTDEEVKDAFARFERPFRIVTTAFHALALIDRAGTSLRECYMSQRVQLSPTYNGDVEKAIQETLLRLREATLTVEHLHALLWKKDPGDEVTKVGEPDT